MTIRSKFLAATIGLVMASGALGGAFAAPTTSIPAKAPTPSVSASKTIAKADATHRLHVVSHRGTTNKMVAHRVTRHGKLAVKIGHKIHLAKGQPVKSHLIKGRLVRSTVAKQHVAKHLLGTQRHAMVAKTSVIR